MARPLDKKAVKERIKFNKNTMKVAKTSINDTFKKGAAAEEFDAVDVRKQLATFIKAANAVRKDTAKL